MLEDPRWSAFLDDPKQFDPSKPRRSLEICHYEDGKFAIDQDELQDAEVADWLDRGAKTSGTKFVNTAEKPISGRFRMLICGKTMGDVFATLPMSKDTVQKLTAVGFPSRFFVSHTRHRRIAAQFPTNDGFALVLRNWKVSVVTLYRRADNTVLSLVILDDDGKNLAADEIFKKCLTSQKHSLNPFMPAIVLSDHALEDYREECDKHMAGSDDVHASLGLSVKHLGMQQRTIRKSAEDSRVSPNKYAKLATDRESLIQLCGSLRSLLDSFEAFQAFFLKFSSAPKNAAAQQFDDNNEFCESMLDYLVITCKDMLNRMQQIETRLQWLFPIFQLRQAEKDTRVTIRLAKTSAKAGVAAQRDSSSMMIIAVLTTLFLPGTFVATLISAPSYAGVWASDNPENYWAVTVPLTFIVMVLVGSWWWWIKTHHESVDEATEKDVEEKLKTAVKSEDDDDNKSQGEEICEKFGEV